MPLLPARRALACIASVLGATAIAASTPAAAHLETARQRAAEIGPLIAAAVSPQHVWPLSRDAASPRPNPSSSIYAALPATDPARFETFAEAARRILTGSAATKHTPEATSRRLATAADAILASVRAAEMAAARAPARPPDFDAALTDLKISALLARFHAHRVLAAVRYNLFLRGLSLAELLAATYTERDAVVLWREIVALTRAPELQAQARDELKKLESNLKELEEQCCPPDETTLKTKIWTPAGMPAWATTPGRAYPPK